MGLEERIQEKLIDGVNYQVSPMAFGVGRQALLRFIKLASPIMSSVLENKGSMETAAAAALRVLPAVLSEEDLKYFATEFGRYSRYQHDNKWVPLPPENQELHFAGRYSAFFGWLAFSIEVNFGPFFRDLLEQGSAAVGAMPGMKAA